MGKPSMVILKNGTGEIVEKKSRFIATLYKVESEEEVTGYINATRKKYWDARHNCYAFVLGDNNETARCSDDGEPSGTAGKPILEVLTGSGVHNGLIIVTRYFGGTLLGTGGLVRAYTQAAKAAIDDAVVAWLINGVKVTVTTDYSGLGNFQYMAANESLLVADVIYTDKVQLVLAFEESRLADVIKKINEISAGKAVYEIEENVPMGRNDSGEEFLLEA